MKYLVNLSAIASIINLFTLDWIFVALSLTLTTILMTVEQCHLKNNWNNKYKFLLLCTAIISILYCIELKWAAVSYILLFVNTFLYSKRK